MTDQIQVTRPKAANASNSFPLSQLLANEEGLRTAFLSGFIYFQREKGSEQSDAALSKLFDDVVSLKNIEVPLIIIGIDIQEAVLCETGLSGIRLQKCRMPKSDFSKSDLRSSSFLESNISGSDFEGAKLANSDFTDATMVGVELTGVKAYVACFARANLSDATLKGHFGEVHYPASHTKAGQIVRRELLGYGIIQASVFKGANFLAADLEGGNFVGCNFQGASFINAYAKNANFRNADFQGAEFDGADFSGCDIRGADFTNANMANINLENALYDKTTKFPPKYGISGAEEAGAITIEMAKLLDDWKGRLD